MSHVPDVNGECSECHKAERAALSAEVGRLREEVARDKSAIFAAVRTENEACARIAEDMNVDAIGSHEARTTIAAAIRQRGGATK